jgi:hypothetical protein
VFKKGIADGLILTTLLVHMQNGTPLTRLWSETSLGDQDDMPRGPFSVFENGERFVSVHFGEDLSGISQ